MILKINSSIPDWWIEEKPKHVGEWWDRLDWRNFEIADGFISQGGGDILGGSILFRSEFAHNVMQFTSHRLYLVADGLGNEIKHIINLVIGG